jgi:hypothetical protein
MIQITPQMRILVAVEAVDFRKGIDGLARAGASPFFAKPDGTSQSPSGAKNWRRLCLRPPAPSCLSLARTPRCATLRQ